MLMRRTRGNTSRIFAQVSGLAIVMGVTSAVRAESTLLDVGYRQMYSLQFDQAHRTFSEWQRLHPEDPMGAVSHAATYLFTEFDRLQILRLQFLAHGDRGSTDRKLAPDPVLKERFEAALSQAAESATLEPQCPNAAFAMVLSHGLRFEYLGLIEKRYAAALKEVRTARLLAQQLLVNHPDNYDAWIAVAVENYMLSIKSVAVRWVVRMSGWQTDRTLEIAELQLIANKGHYLAPFARLLLAVVALRDHDIDRAHELLEALARDFPNSPLYRQELASLSR
jgi:tetratricopeptide (TPR) repeat protein